MSRGHDKIFTDKRTTAFPIDFFTEFIGPSNGGLNIMF